MLHHITWHQYFTGIALAAVTYYAVIIFRCYRPQLQRIIQQLNGRSETGHLPEALLYHDEVQQPAATTTHPNHFSGHQSYQQEALTEYDHLAAALQACIAKAADKPFAPAILLPQLKEIVQAQHETTSEVTRRAVNELIVNECEKSGTALLTEDEVDQWWSD